VAVAEAVVVSPLATGAVAVLLEEQAVTPTAKLTVAASKAVKSGRDG
jgi:hypothetical protein